VLAASPGFITGKRLVADALLIALAANLANLLDRAPGRTIKWSLAAYIPFAVVAGTGEVAMAVAPVMGAALGVFGDDLRERVMLGDTGANVLGAVLGLGVVLDVGRGSRNAILVALIVLNVAAELVSFSAVIERLAPLRAFDGLGRRTLSVSPDTGASTAHVRRGTTAPARTRRAAGAREGP
jgi:UDP-N-acetylmuramyl pentapeptide phosphotransferase/UDP-N-acetylglucosamine-1-phosphate transferase